jgi:hypothetical protein
MPWVACLTYLWLLAPQLGMLERRLQVRRHAVDDIAVGTLPKKPKSASEIGHTQSMMITAFGVAGRGGKKKKGTKHIYVPGSS